MTCFDTGEHFKPDVLVVATSAKMHRVFKILTGFFSPRPLRALTKILLAMRPFVGKRVVIMGGRLHGCQTAEYLLHLKREVTIVDEGTEEDIGDGMLEIFVKTCLLHWLKDHGGKFVTNVQNKEITKKGLVVVDEDEAEWTIQAEMLITALLIKTDAKGVDTLGDGVEEVCAIGAIDTSRYIVNAIASGAKIGHAA